MQINIILNIYDKYDLFIFLSISSNIVVQPMETILLVEEEVVDGLIQIIEIPDMVLTSMVIMMTHLAVLDINDAIMVQEAGVDFGQEWLVVDCLVIC